MDELKFKKYEIIKNFIITYGVDEKEVVDLYKLALKHLKEIG